MVVALKKLIFTIYFNFYLLLALVLVIQNSSNRSKINLIFKESIELPLSFIIGSSFLSGSLTGGLINVIYKK